MEADRLAQLGLTVADAGEGLEAVLSLDQAVVNPLTRRVLPAVTFALEEDCLIPLEPPELVGLPPLSVGGMSGRAELEQQLLASFEQHVHLLQERTRELRALGISPRVEPDSLELHAEVEAGDLRFEVTGDKRGTLRITQVFRAGTPLRSELGEPFTPTRFTDRAEMAAYLLGLVGPPAAATGQGFGLTFAELAERFGRFARVPEGGTAEVVVDFRVHGERYRFVAARVKGRTFRALLAGPDGKKWADHFTLDDFAGVADVAARALGVQPGEVEWLGAEEGA
jgi:hypothetical protein